MPESIKDCRCIDGDDKHELSKAIVTRIEVYRKRIEDVEMEDTINQIKNIKKGEKVLRLSPKSTKEIVQYNNIINRLESLYERLNNTPECV